MESYRFLYETLSPLSTTVAVSSPSTTPPPAPEYSGEPYPYFVLRNHIPMFTDSTPLPETSAPDFISLDDDDDSDDWRILTPPFKRSRLASSLSDEETERRFEAGWFRANCRFQSPMIQLHKEILDFCDFLSPTAEEQISRNIAVESVSAVIKHIWPNCKVEVFGSFKTGLFLPTSDVDMVILRSNIQTPQTGLCALSKVLSQRGVAKKIQVLGKARVPIIKFVETKSGISFDISFDMENGPKAAEYIKVYSGGIGSFALLAMLIAMLQNSQDNHSFPQYNLGVLLITFFDMYGCKLNTSDVGISCNEGSTFFSKKSKGFIYSRKKLLISIQDPQIKSSFRMACSTLTDTELIMSLGPDRSILGTIIRPDKVLLERKGGLNNDINLLPGAEESLQNDLGEHEGHVGKHEEEPLPQGKDIVVSSDGGGVAKKSKKVVKIKKIVKVKKIKKVIIIKEKKKTSTGTEC